MPVALGLLGVREMGKAGGPRGVDSRWAVVLQSDDCLASGGLSCHSVPKPVVRAGPRGRPLLWPLHSGVSR